MTDADDLVREARGIAAELTEAASAADAPALRVRLEQAASVIERLAKGLPKPDDEDPPLTLDERIGEQRSNLNKAQAIVDVCRLALNIEEHFSLHSTLNTAHHLIGVVARQLDVIAADVSEQLER